MSGMDWREYLKPEEVARLDQLAAERAENKAERRRIYDRCLKRMKVKNNA